MSGLTVIEHEGVHYVEGPPGMSLMRSINDASLVIESCFSARVSCVLLYAPNLTSRFFDLSSGEAGVILQKLRTYGIRLAVVCDPDFQFSTKFSDLLMEEHRMKHF